MFNSKMKTYSLHKKATTTNKYNEETNLPLEFVANIDMFISLSSQEIYSVADMRIGQSSHIGLTKYDGLKKGMIIGKQYEVLFVNGAGSEKIVFLKELENNGHHN